MTKILIVEDDPDIRQLLEAELRRCGHEPVFAFDGIGAIGTARREQPDLILLDLGLPGGDGHMVLERLAGFPALAQIPVVIVSARDSLPFREKALAKGAVAYLQKPFSRDELVRAIETARGNVTEEDTAGQAMPADGLRAPSEPDGAPRTERPLVLVVDDEPDIRSLVALRLERAAYRVATAGDGVEAYEVAVELQPDLIVLDVGMPGQDGFETSRRLRAHPRTAHVPIVFLTARVQEIDVARGYAHGGDGYVTKPFDPAELLARIESLVGVGRMRELAAG